MTKTLTQIFVFGSLIAFVWEIYQMPFFEPGSLSLYEQTMRCGVASLGDGLILLIGYWLASLQGGSDWPWHKGGKPYAIYFAFGLFIAVAVELIATSLPQMSVPGWRYSALMPLMPVTGLALIPLAMWVIVPSLTLGLLRLSQPGNACP